MKRIILALVMLATPVLAQQPQPTPSQTALQISNMLGQIQSIISQWGPGIEALQKQNADLQAQLAAVTKERDELKAKEKENAK